MMKPTGMPDRAWLVCIVLALLSTYDVLAQVSCAEPGPNVAVLSEKELLRRATKRVQPAIPGGFGRIDAVVEVSTLVGTDGKVVCAEAREPSHPLLQKYCEEAAREWRFRPLKQAGSPIQFWGPIRFRIKR